MDFRHTSRLPVPARVAYEWHMRPGAFRRLQPPWEKVTATGDDAPPRKGSRVRLRVPMGPLRLSWEAEHRDLVPGRQFTDVQRHGPFRRWVHRHRFTPDGEDACLLDDAIDIGMPLGALGELLAGPVIRRRLRRMFTYRHAVTARDLEAHAAAATPPLRVAVSGAGGFLGSSLVPFLTTGGHQVVPMVRRRRDDRPGVILWDPAAGDLDPASIAGFDAVIHLAGEPIAGRWSAAKKRRIRASRVESTTLLARALAALPSPPSTLLCASAIGIYGDRGDEILDEDSAPGAGFLAEVGREWEAACPAAAAAGIRVVNLRFGVILSPAGGALAQMLTPFRAGVGGVLGSGRQFMSWVTLDDAVGAVHHALTRREIRGPVNVVAPSPLTNREFTRTLGRVLARPTVLPVPAFVLKLALGEMAESLLLSSARVLPRTLQAHGYRFRHPDLTGALHHVLGRRAAQEAGDPSSGPTLPG